MNVFAHANIELLRERKESGDKMCEVINELFAEETAAYRKLAEEAKTRAEEAKTRAEEAQTRAEEAQTRAEVAEAELTDTKNKLREALEEITRLKAAAN